MAAASRTLVSGYVRRFGGWSTLCEAIARVLGVSPGDVIDLEADGDPVVFLSARTQHGEFAIELQAFIDERRAPGFHGKDAFVLALARELGEDLLYDDGGSPVPYRWVLVRPDGARFEVFERPAGGTDLVLDPDQPPRRLDPAPGRA